MNKSVSSAQRLDDPDAVPRQVSLNGGIVQAVRETLGKHVDKRKHEPAARLDDPDAGPGQVRLNGEVVQAVGRRRPLWRLLHVFRLQIETKDHHIGIDSVNTAALSWHALPWANLSM